MPSGSNHPRSPFNLFLTAASPSGHFTANGAVSPIEGGWMIVLRNGSDEDRLCLFAPDERAEFVHWIARHLPPMG